MYDNKNVAGLWIDHNKALVISTPDKNHRGEYDVVEKIESNHSVSRSGSDHTQNQKKIQELQKYFKDVIQHLGGYDVLHVFGPGLAQEEFKNFVEKDNLLRNTEMDLGSADSHLTSNQMVAIVRNHFNK